MAFLQKFRTRAVELLGGRVAVVDAKRSLTSESTLKQLGGGGGYGGFDAAKLGRLTNDWASISRSADQDLTVDLRRLRSRARVQAMNSPIASKFLSMVRSNVVGQHGVKLAFKVQKQRKSKNGALDDDANEELHRAWHEWGKRGSCTVCGRYSWRELQRLIIENTARDGECLLRKVFVSKDTNPSGFQLQLIDADQLDDNYNLLAMPNGNQVRMGVEVDVNQKPIAYHLYDGNPFEATSASTRRVRVPAEQIIHFYVAHRTGQSRGYPFFASTMSQLKMLDGYFLAELTGARISSELLMSIESKGDNGDDEVEADGINADGSKAIDINAGTALELASGQHLVNNTPQHPSTAFDPFLRGSNRMIASGMNVAYHKLCNDLAGINYSSSRTGELEEREYWMELQSQLIDDVLEPIYDTWQKSAQLNGAIDLPFDLKKYTGPALKWEPRRWPWVDPLKDVQASTLLVQNGFETHESILNSQGRDLNATYTQLQKEQELADSLGLSLGTDIRGQGTSEVNNEDETPEGGAQQNEKPAKPKVKPASAPAKPKAKNLDRGMHPANAALWDLVEDTEK